MDYIDEYCAITEYRPGEFHRTRTSVFSFIKNNEWFTGRIIILSTDPISLTPFEESQIQRIYHDVEYRVVDLEFPKDLIKRINKKSLNRSVISEYLYLYALKIKSRGNIFFSNSVVFNKDVIPFINSECVTAARKAGVLPQGSGFDVNHKLYYIPGSETSDNLYKRAVKIMGEVSSLHDPSSKSLIFTSSLLEFKIEVNIIDLHNLVDSSRFSKSRYSNFVRYSKSIVALNMNTLENSEPNLFTRINSFWSNINRESLAYKPIETKISKRAAEDLEVKKQKRYTDNQKISKTLPKFNKNRRLIQLDIDNPDLEVSQDALNSNIALYTICNDEFMIGAKVMIQSFLKNNTWFKGDIVVLYNGTYSGLSHDSMNLLTSIYDKIKFTEVDESPYVNLIAKFKKTGSPSQLRFIPSLFTFEIFEEVSKYDYLLYLDSDMLIRSDLSDLFKFDHEMIVTPDAGEYNTNSPVRDFNGGFMLLANRISINKYRDQLISHAMGMHKMSLADQTIMNSFFTGNLHSAGVNYNCLKRCFQDGNFHNFNSNVKVIHYVGAKPWHSNKPLFETKYSKIESLWQRELSLLEKGEDVHISQSDSSELNIVTSACNINDIQSLKGNIMTTNWGISLNLKKINYYLCTVTDPDLIKIINKLGNNVDTWMTTDNVKHLISRQLVNKKWMQSFKYMNNLGELGRIHMRPKDMRNGNNLPTSGVQLIYIASFMKIDKLNILGINLYTVKDDVGNYKISCLTSKENPYKLTNKPHDIKTDLIFVIESFKRMISKGINIKVDSYILRSILDMCKSNIADIEIIKKTISKYDL